MENQINNDVSMEEGVYGKSNGSDWNYALLSDEVSQICICQEDYLGLIHKALVIAHQQFVSWGNYDEALKITKLIAENLDDI
mgnify:CR=1 FL=1